MKGSVLLIDDEADLVQAMKDYLEDEGLDVTTASNGKEALEKLSSKNMPDIIILDMKMPIMDGRTFAHIFHERFDDDAPIILVSGDANAQKNALSIQATGWIEKPFKLDELLSKINEYVPDAP